MLHHTFNTYRNDIISLCHTDNPKALLTCTLLDGDPDTRKMGLSGRGWNIVKNLKLPRSVAEGSRGINMAAASWLYRVNYDASAIGRGGRSGRIENLQKNERTIGALADLSKNHPAQHFAVWWQLCSNAEEMKVRKGDQKQERNSKARGKGKGKG